MGASIQQGGGGGGRRGKRRAAPPMSEINVTPFVDVMLVLLIIFMVAAPLLTVGVEVEAAKADLPKIELPKTEAGPINAEKEPLNISVDPDGKIFLQDTAISFDELVPKLTAIRETGSGDRVWVRGDNRTAYGNVVKVLARIKEAGLPVTLVTDQVDQVEPGNEGSSKL
ncbi:MAG TPA: ExbD/TolR family protein [Methyloceanibacter sp.]|jgi:biopolymer transport protein TolR|nr:ExbD/TolR family protein [Methyloceanibacter sp.]